MPRLAVVEREKCSPIECGNYLCMRFCPVNRMGRECIVIGDDKKVNIGEELCTGCGICVKKCPFGALSIINLPAELDETPIHQYGENGFRLYSLPTPVFGKVVEGLEVVDAIGNVETDSRDRPIEEVKIISARVI